MRFRLWQQRPLALKLTLIITFVIVVGVSALSLLTIQRERQYFRKELEQQADLLLNTITASGADALYFLNADYLSDLMLDLGLFGVVEFGRIYDREGRVVADAVDQTVRFNIEPDPLGLTLISGNGETVFIWSDDLLLAGKAVILGTDVVGAVSVGLPTAPLAVKLAGVRNQGIIVAVAVVINGLILALLISRSITEPLKEMIAATETVRSGDLTRRVDINSGDELEALGEHFNQMTAQLELTLHRMEDEIEVRKQTQTELIEAKETAESANQAKSTFLANMSHELRTPLNAILGFAQIMSRRQTINPKDKNNLDIIIQSGKHLLVLINQVLDMSKIEADRMSLHETDFSLDQILKDLEGMFRLPAAENQVQFMIECAPQTPRIFHADQLKLRQVLINLLNNAIKFTGEGQVKLRVWFQPDAGHDSPAQRNSLYFQVEDTGPGLQPEELNKIFDAFIRTNAGIQSGEGTGLGLSLSRQFVRLMGGELVVRNVSGEPGYGAVFEFYIPASPQKRMRFTETEIVRQVVRLQPNQRAVRILIVDGSEPNRQLLVEVLEPLGFQVAAAQNRSEAVNMWERWRPTVILMELQILQMIGYEAVRQMAIGSGQQTIVLGMTARTLSPADQLIIDTVCHDFLQKPFETHEILTAIRQHTGVEYIYDNLEARPVTAVSDTVSNQELLNGRRLRRLPENMREDLEEATVQADMMRIDALIQDVQFYDEDVAVRLKQLADDFEYSKILTWLTTEEN